MDIYAGKTIKSRHLKYQNKSGVIDDAEENNYDNENVHVTDFRKSSITLLANNQY